MDQRYQPQRSTVELSAPTPLLKLARIEGSLCGVGTDPTRWWCTDTLEALWNQGGGDLSLTEERSVPALDELQFGAAFACGLDAEGAVACYGDDDGGRLGRGVPPLFNRPTLATGWNAAGAAADAAGE